MKRVMVLLVLITLAINGVAFADAPICDVEIKFRGLEWGCSIDEAMANIQAAGVESTKIEKDEDVHFLVYSTSVDESGFAYTPYQLPNDFYVAGHLVEQVCAYAIYGMVDGKISKKTADSKLYKGTYYFETTENTREIYDDLVEKLNGLYGKATENKESYSEYSLRWCGLNDTAVVIEFDDGKYPMLHIDYWDLGCYDLIVEMQRAAYTGDIASTDGL